MKKKEIKPRDPYAFALLSKIFQQKIVKNKKKYNRKNKHHEIKQAFTENYEKPVFLLAKFSFFNSVFINPVFRVSF